MTIHVIFINMRLHLNSYSEHSYQEEWYSHSSFIYCYKINFLQRYDNPVGSGIFYNECVHLETTGFLPGIHRLASKSTCTMSLHCYYFTHWANYAALCISHLVNPHAADSLFLNNFNVHRHCFTSMLDMWNMMGQYLHLTAEHRFDLINSCFGKVYDVSGS